MFLSHGYEATSLDTLIARAGGSRRNIYDRFGGKEGLFKEVVSQLCANFLRPLEELDVQGQDPKTALSLFGRRVFEGAFDPRGNALLRLLIAEGHRIPALAQMRAESKNLIDVVSDLIGKLQSGGGLRTDVPAADLAEQFVNLVMSGPKLHFLLGMTTVPTPESAARFVDRAVETFLNGAGVKERGRAPNPKRRR